VPVLLLGFLVLASGLRRGLTATAIIWVIGGLGTWLVAPEHTIHLGASVLVFGWLVYLVLRGFFARRFGEILLGLVLLAGYGSLLWGVLPGQPGISWQGHLFGAIGGAVAARTLRHRPAGRGRTRPVVRSRP
jgi:membrane associated rhomboid family serine protease